MTTRHAAACLLAAVSTVVTFGCASGNEEVIVTDAEGYRPQLAAALYATPPVLQLAQAEGLEMVALDEALNRDGRQNAAFVGFDSPEVVTYDLVVRDEQYVGGLPHLGGFGFGGFGTFGYGFGDYYNRSAVSTRSFTRTR